MKVKAKEATDDLNYCVPVTGIIPAGKKVFIQLDYQTTGKFALISIANILFVKLFWNC